MQKLLAVDPARVPGVLPVVVAAVLEAHGRAALVGCCLVALLRQPLDADAVIDAIDVRARASRSFTQGEIDTSEIVFFLTWPMFFLFVAVRALEMRRWRG